MTTNLRPEICGPDTPEAPYPIYLRGVVEKGFGRGSKELGCPTANLPADQATDMQTGVHYGFARVLGGGNEGVFPMVMSVGYNPFYKNTHKTAEVHILHGYTGDFYGMEMRVVVLGYIRPELDYSGVDALKADIATDMRVAGNSVARRDYEAYRARLE